MNKEILFHPQISNINGLLDDIYRRYIELKDKEFEEHYTVFQTIFWRLHELMKEVDPYYKRYSTTTTASGSTNRIEIDIEHCYQRCRSIIHEHPRVPERSDVILEHKDAGLRPVKDGEKADWHINMTAYKWLDEKEVSVAVQVLVLVPERCRSSVKLLRQETARNILYSSGRRHVYIKNIAVMFPMVTFFIDTIGNARNRLLLGEAMDSSSHTHLILVTNLHSRQMKRSAAAGIARRTPRTGTDPRSDKPSTNSRSNTKNNCKKKKRGVEKRREGQGGERR
ncbi:hypothetical protein MSG28_016122 [Choristoneura fumiferana]|uniref:Uncharacterized protein n=1 Tax=Choristoneura fumiferana TaxID=7141 RepID=A0ACC0K5D9_CHOFU|nr:hypothetical protein MSG28_016122 [Choristoneura fumiferana]